MTLTLTRADLDTQAAVFLARPRPRPERRAAGDAELDVVDRWGVDSFPASDPPANW